MGNFANNAITDVGKMLLADVQAGAVFVPTRIVIGSGSMSSGATPQGMTDVITPVTSLAINKKKRTPDGKCVFGGVYTNAEVTAPFYFRELALYAKAVYHNEDGSVKSEGAETLYSYGNAGATADYMPAYSTSTVVEKQIDLVVWVGNDAQVDLTIASGVYVTHDQAVLNYKSISPETVGYDTLLEYMAAIYDENCVVCGNIYGFSDMPEGVTNLHGTINVVGGQLTVSGNSRTAFYYRGTNSLTKWTSEWRKAYDATADLVIEKAIAAVKMVTPNGSGQLYKNANASNDLGTMITDSTKEGVTDRVEFSAARTLADKLRLVVGNKLYNILHTGNKDLIKPADIGAAPAGYGLGGESKFLSSADDLNSIIKNGWYSWHESLPDNAPAAWGNMIVTSQGGHYSQTVILFAQRGCVVQRTRVGDAWGEWEWVNPPLHSYVEYRTTERHQGIAVYKKIDDNGNILWRKEGENVWHLWASASYFAPATVE